MPRQKVQEHLVSKPFGGELRIGIAGRRKGALCGA